MRDIVNAVTFRSKIDAWYYLCAIVSICVVSALVLVFWTYADISYFILMCLAEVAIIALFVALPLKTRYILEDDSLNVESPGSKKVIIRYSDIKSVEESTLNWSSPALSLDRIDIKYGNDRILISPQNKKEFMNELEKRINSQR